MGYFVSKTLVKGEGKDIVRSAEKGGRSSKPINVVGYEIGKTGIDKTIILSKEDAVRFIAKNAPDTLMIDNAQVLSRTTKDKETSFYLKAAGAFNASGKNLRDLDCSILDAKGAVLPKYAALANIAATHSTKSARDVGAMKAALEAKLGSKNFEF